MTLIRISLGNGRYDADRGCACGCTRRLGRNVIAMMKLHRIYTPLAQPFSGLLSRHGSIRAAAIVLFSGLGLHLALQLLGPAIFSNPNWAVYWPLDAITLAVLLMVPRSYWPGFCWEVRSTRPKPAITMKGRPKWRLTLLPTSSRYSSPLTCFLHSEI